MNLATSRSIRPVDRSQQEDLQADEKVPYLITERDTHVPRNERQSRHY